MRGHRDQRGRAVDVGLLEQAAAPAEPGHAERTVARRLDAVRRERQVEDRADVREHLVPALASGGEDDGGLDPTRHVDCGARDGERGVGVERVVLRDVQRRDPVLAH